jgi:hypothetical protein
MRSRRFYLALTVSLVLVAAACGGSDEGGGDENVNSATTTTTAATGQSNGDGTTTTPPPDDGDGTTTTPPPDDGDSAPRDQPPVGEAGSFTVNGTEFVVTLLNRCIPFGGEDGQTIDLQPIAQGQGAELFLYGTADSLEVSVQGSTVSEMYGSIAFTASPFGDGEIQESSIDGDRWTGSATLIDALDVADPVSVTWDVMVTDEVRDCSL